MGYWIFKVSDQTKYSDIFGEKYLYDNTHSIKVKKGDHFLYLSTKKNKYEFLGYGIVGKLDTRDPAVNEKRNDRVHTIYLAHLKNIKWFNEPLDFSSGSGKVNRDAVGVENTLGWGNSIPKLSEELFNKIIKIAQPGTSKKGARISLLTNKDNTQDSWNNPRAKSKSSIGKIEKNVTKKSEFSPESLSDAREKTLSSLVVRRGQPKFRKDLIEAYGGKCAVTGFDIVEALQAAHIVPYRGDDTNTVDNGLLLRSDIHDLFDLGLITIDESYKILLHESLLQSSYTQYHNQTINLPEKKEWYPNILYLNWHRSWWNTKR
ncbi:hypothetical protein QE429_003857 [Bacillus sp. SORGH_AS 510]|uniref:HNH endonuclease n=1 Tax=Bacillus sp. SORGH_AS_0510 TaxID=3041771 RepID=UPI002781D264|nr:HNH endonuclease [Bacillus sp. SORGH_AS_0510]MDQ1147030.1 hypothetical protein [Bacillus sp. SORGH_AS_0510]